MITYTLSFSPTQYTISAEGKQTAPQLCEFGPVTETEAALMTLTVGLGDLLVRIQRADKEPFNYGVIALSELPETYEQLNFINYEDLPPKATKLRARALGLLRRFGEWKVDTEAERV